MLQGQALGLALAPNQPMLSSRNIHFAVLGIILGASSGYIFAFYQIDKNLPVRTKTLDQGGGSSSHPSVSNDQILAMFKEQLAKDPENAEVWSRYGDFLSDNEQYIDAVAAYKKVVELEPDNLDAQTFMGTALWNLGKKTEAIALYEKSLKANPNHLPSLYYLAMVDIDQTRDLKAASDKLAKMEKIDPKQPALKQLRERIEDERKKAK